VPVNEFESFLDSNRVPSSTLSGAWQSTFDPHELSRNEEECVTPNNVAETTPGPRNFAAPWMATPSDSLNSPPAAPKSWGQINSNLNKYYSNQMDNSSTFWILEITG
jgi:hypothetical protein